MNVLVIATHHGAFLTIQSLKNRRIKNVVVVMLQSQIDKYSKFEGEIFTKFESNIKSFCKYPVYVCENWNPKNKLKSAYDFLHTLGLDGKWAVLEAGTILGAAASEKAFPKTSTFGATTARVHKKFKRLYTMLGQEEESKTLFTGSFFINMDDKSGRLSFIDSDLVHRPDILYSKSFGTLWCIRYQQMVPDAFTINFWMEAIRGNQEDGEIVAYPYDLYAKLAKKLGKYLPPSTHANIMENGSKTAWLGDLVALDL